MGLPIFIAPSLLVVPRPHSAVQVAIMFSLYETAGVVTNLAAGRRGSAREPGKGEQGTWKHSMRISIRVVEGTVRLAGFLIW